MNDNRTPAENIKFVVGLHLRGVICPSEMWFQIANSLTSKSANVVLESLPVDTQSQLRALYIEVAPIAYDQPSPSMRDNAEFREVCAQIREFCERG